MQKTKITEHNFEKAFEHWNKIFGNSIKNEFITISKYFVCDIQKGKTHLNKKEGKAYFNFDNGEIINENILIENYKLFWNKYEKINSSETLRIILSEIDKLKDKSIRRFHGEFFTPLPFAKKGLDYIEKSLGKNWWQSGEYRIWDMAAGTGNLEYHLPNESYKYLYLSTLYQSEVEHCEKLFPDATIFQYDYLNDDIKNVFENEIINYNSNWKLPKKLRTDLSNPNLKWIILINPPYATSQTAGKNSKSKADVSNTNVRKEMHKQNLGEASRELAMQFIFRLKTEFENKKIWLGLFYKIKHLNSNNDQKFRDNIFKFHYENGFMFSSANFSGTSKASPFPVAFMFWEVSQEKHIEEQTLILDVFDNYLKKNSVKNIKPHKKQTHLSKWIKRPPAKIKFPPLGSAINTKFENKDKRDRIADGFLASFMCAGNDFQSQNQTALASAPFVSAGALSVTSDNFEKSMVIHAVRRIPKTTWKNDRDQFLQPKKSLEQEFINDCTIWTLFSNSNQTAAMKDVEYENVIYQINNHFFPFLLSEIKTWEITNSNFRLSLENEKDRFVAEWLLEKKLSKEAKEVFEAGKDIYKFYFANINQLRTNLFEIKTWDAGFWQIRKTLQDQNLSKNLFKILKQKNSILKNKLLNQIYDYEFLISNI